MTDQAATEKARRHFVIGTRESQLAMVQTHFVLNSLQKVHPEYTFSIHGMTTKGDKILDVALSKIGSKSLFTKELEVALADKTADLVVHSLKDVPTTLPEGMCLGAMMEREDPRDAVVMSLSARSRGIQNLEDLPDGSVIGTSSVRRIAQLRRRFPKLVFQDVRGNLNTRLSKLDAPEGPYAALLLAYAGVHRLGWDDRISQVLPPSIILHAVGQGALGIECRADDTTTIKLLSALDHWETRLRCTAERAFMRYLEGGCSVPLGTSTQFHVEQNKLHMLGSVSSVDGKIEIREEAECELGGADRETDLREAESLGEHLGKLLVQKGAREILDKIKANRVVLAD